VLFDEIDVLCVMTEL